jgi:hypothetical protein
MRMRKGYIVLVCKPDHLGDLGIDGGMILQWILKVIACEDVSWSYLAQDRNQWWVF